MLPLVRVGREPEGPGDQVAIDVRVVGRDVGDQLIDELLMLFVSLNNGHRSSVLRGFSAPFPPSRGVTQVEESLFR